MSINSNNSIKQNPFYPRSLYPCFDFYPIDGMGLLGRRSEYRAIEKDIQLNAWVDQLCVLDYDTTEDMDKENRKFIPVKKMNLKDQYTFKFAKAKSLSRVKQIINFVDIYPESSTARVQRALKSENVLVFHKALLGAHVQNQIALAGANIQN